MVQTTTRALTVRPLDPADDALLDAVHTVTSASSRHERPWAILWSRRELAVQVRKPTSAEAVAAWVAELDGVVAGVAIQWLPLLDNTSMSWFDLDVHPDHRGRGAGSALLDQVVLATREAGRTTLLVEPNVPDADREQHPYRTFLEGRGFTYANTEIRRVLDLPVDPAVLEAFVAEAAARHQGYRIETYVDGLPEHLRASYCEASNQLGVDAPTGEIDFEEEAMTPEIYQEHLDCLAEQGRTFLSTVALSPEGDVVGYNDLVVPVDSPEDVMQWGTLVVSAHRGRRLGLAVKARGLQELVARYPERRRVQTCNAEQNGHMVGINERLGFRRVEAVLSMQRDLTAT